MRTTSRAKQIQLGFITFALLYAIVGNYTWLSYQRDFFPIYSFDLFSYVPSRTSEFAIRFTTINGHRLDTLLYFNSAGTYIPAAQTIEAFALIQRFGNAVYTNSGEAKALRDQFEAHYLPELGTVDYDLVIRAFAVGAFFFVEHRAWRLHGALGLLFLHALINSFGKINHSWHAWILAAGALVFLPAGPWRAIADGDEQ